MKRACASLIVLAMTITDCGAAAAKGASDTLVLEPVTHWNINYADDSCRLSRAFGRGDETTIVSLERYAPGDGFFLIVAGKPFQAFAKIEPYIQFGPDGYELHDTVAIGEFGDFKPALFAASMRFYPSPDGGDDASRDMDWHEAAEKDAEEADIFKQKISPEQEAAITWLEVRRRSRKIVRLDLGSMGPPMEAMRTCTDELLTHWGIDLKAHAGLTRRVMPRSNPGNWIQSSDYPRDLLSNGAQGIVQVRLSVDATGKPTECHIQKSTRPEGFDDAVCDALMRRASFEPALGADGQPIASFWRSGVRFQMAAW